MVNLTITPFGLMLTAFIVMLLAMYITHQFYDPGRHYEHFSILANIFCGGVSFILGILVSLLFK